MRTKSKLLIVFYFLFVSKIAIAQDSSRSKVEESWQNYINTIELDPSSLSQEDNTEVSSMLVAGRNYALNVYSFSFFAVRYKLRGYDIFSGRSYINGVPINSLQTNMMQYGLFSGMNNLFKVEETTEQLASSDFTFGGIGNHFLLSTSSLNQRSKLRINSAYSNRNYQYRLGVSYSSGFNRKDWSYLLATNIRYTKQGYYPGSFYNGSGFLFSVDKKIKKNMLSLSAWFSDNESGRSGAAVKETFGLSHSNYYNPQWGYQNGKRRNANVLHSFLPTATIRYQSFLSEKINLNSAIGFTMGKVSNSQLEWYNAPDPRPDYYRYLPSYFKNDAYQYDQLTERYKSDADLLQIRWDDLYQVNNAQNDGRSLYALGERVSKTLDVNGVSTLSVTLDKHYSLNIGIEFQYSKQRNYKEMKDLLGGQYWKNINAFIERDNPSDISTIQNDVDNPNRKILEGDKYSYDYQFNNSKFSEWFQINKSTKKWDAFVATEIGIRQLSRVGNVRNGLFPNNSFGKDPVLTSFFWSGKLGWMYKFDGRKYLFVNAAILQQPPLQDVLYVSPATRNFRNDSLSNMNIKTIETGFVVNAPKWKFRTSLYYTQLSHAGEYRYFYDDIHQNFASYRMLDISKRYYGLELSIEWNFYKNWTYSLLANLSKSLYSNRPRLVVTSETDANVLLDEQVFLNNYRIANTPQSIMHHSFGYRNSGNFVSINANFFFDRWAAFNPMRRTITLLQDINPVSQSSILTSALSQEKLPNGYTLDISGGHTFSLNRNPKHRIYLDVFFSANNLLNRKDIIAYGFEQMRFDTKGYDITKFPNKYSYAMGCNYSVNLNLRF